MTDNFPQKTADLALIVIGSELVDGSISDENRTYISAGLRQVGLEVTSAHIVRDDVKAAATLIRFLAGEAAYVITVGGLGPTIDDVTMQAVGVALGLDVVDANPLSPAEFAAMSGSETDRPRLRHVPATSEIIETGHGPIVRTANIYSLPGLPRLVRERFPALLARLEGRNALVARELNVRLPQSQIAQTLERVSRTFPAVTIGCYPSMRPVEITRIVLSGHDLASVEGSIALIQNDLGEAAQPGWT